MSDLNPKYQKPFLFTQKRLNLIEVCQNLSKSIKMIDLINFQWISTIFDNLIDIFNQTWVNINQKLVKNW